MTSMARFVLRSKLRERLAAVSYAGVVGSDEIPWVNLSVIS